MYYVIAVLVFGLLILIHEFGHFITARIFGVRVREFSIGMGPKLFSKVSKKNQTKYSLRLLPIGGYVSMQGEDSETEAGEDPQESFGNKAIWKRMIIVSAGALMNLLLGFLIMTTLVMQTKVFATTTIAKFDSEVASSHQTGLEVGDTIVKIGSTRVHIDYDLMYAIMRKGVEPVDVTVIRDGKEIVIANVVFPVDAESGVAFGDRDFSVYGVKRNFPTVMKYTFYRSVSCVKMVVTSVGDLIRGRYGMDAVSGPVGVASAIGSAASDGFGVSAKQGFQNLFYMMVIISINLGIANLLPLPALDGGRLLILIIEGITRKKMDPKYEGMIHLIGLLLLMALMLLVTYRDIVKLITG